MSEEVARAVGSNGVTTVRIGGKDCTTRPLKLKELGEIERECVNQYVEAYMAKFSRGLAMVEPDAAERKRLVREELDRVSKWDVKSLPAKLSCDVERIAVTEKLEAWVIENFPDALSPVGPDGVPDEERRKRNLTVQQHAGLALDQDMLSIEDFEKLTGALPKQQRVPYVMWWITGSMSGMLEMCYAAFAHNGVTRDQVNAEIGSNRAIALALAREIESLTAPTVTEGK